MDELKLPRVTSCCCGLQLETGVKIIGYLHVTGVFGGFLSAFFFEVGHEIKDYKGHYEDSDYTFSRTFFRDELLLASVFYTILSAIIFLLGIKKRDTVLLEPFVITKGTSVFLSLLQLGTSVIARLLKFKSVFIFIQLISLGLECYMFIVLHSYYKESKQKYRDLFYNDNISR